jgi:hypothetical protein
MTERRWRDDEPTNESSSRVRDASAREWLDEMRVARQAERAPEGVRERLLERARELSQSVEGQAATLPLDIQPQPHASRQASRHSSQQYSLGLLGGQLPGDKRHGEGVRVELGPLGAWAHPLLARAAGAGLMLALVVLVIADVRHPDGSARAGAAKDAEPANAGEPATDRGAAAVLAESVARAAQSAVAGAVQSPAAGAVQSAVAGAVQSPAAGAVQSPSSEPEGTLAAGEWDTSDAPPELPELLAPGPLQPEAALRAAVEAEPVAMFAARSARERPRASRAGGPLDAAPADDALAPWLSPHAALSAIRNLAKPHLAGAPGYPKGTRILARGNVRPERGRNFITNGDFSRGDLMWSVRSWQGFGDSSVAPYYSVQAGALCTSIERSQQVLGGWPWDDRRLSPSSFDLERGKRYRLSLRAWSSGPELVQLVVKVGQQSPPYTPALVARVPITAEPGLFDIDFVSPRHDTRAGFAFVATGSPEQPLSEFCIDDVSVRPLDADP